MAKIRYTVSITDLDIFDSVMDLLLMLYKKASDDDKDIVMTKLKEVLPDYDLDRLMNKESRSE